MNVGYGAKQKPVWTRLTVWGKQAEFICQYGKKGDMVVWSGGQYMIEEFNGNNGLIKTHYFELGQSAQLNLLSKAGGSEEKPQERSDADDSGAQSPDSYA
jgi:single-stranded DNA-binding protein